VNKLEFAPKLKQIIELGDKPKFGSCSKIKLNKQSLNIQYSARLGSITALGIWKSLRCLTSCLLMTLFYCVMILTSLSFIR
jgi:hypothetical protein